MSSAKQQKEDKTGGVSPVISVAMIMIIVVGSAGLVTVVVFDSAGDGMDPDTTDPILDVDYKSEALINVQLLRGSEANVTVESALGTEYSLDYAGDSVEIPNQESDNIPSAYTGNGGDKTLFQRIPPQSFEPDSVVRKGDDLQEIIKTSQENDTIVVQRDNYVDSIEINKSLTIIAEDGTEIQYDGTEDYVLKSNKPSRIINANIDTTSPEGKEADVSVNTTHNSGNTIMARSKIVRNPSSSGVSTNKRIKIQGNARGIIKGSD